MARRRRTVGRVTPGAMRGSPLQPFSPFTPYGTPPTGSYDPALDAQLGAANRGLFDQGQDTQTQRERLGTDYNLQRGDLITAEDRATQDHQRALDMLTRNYSQLANRQAQGQARAGVMGGGAVLQAAAKRAANRALEQAPIDTAYSRFTADNQSAQGRLALQMAPPDAGNPLGGRAFQDLNTGFTRAQREGSQFGLDTAAEKAYQASGAGWEPGKKPANEFIGPRGVYRGIRRGGTYFGVNPDGTIRFRRPVRR
jgi:hypothetical protein